MEYSRDAPYISMLLSSKATWMIKDTLCVVETNCEDAPKANQSARKSAPATGGVRRVPAPRRPISVYAWLVYPQITLSPADGSRKRARADPGSIPIQSRRHSNPQTWGAESSDDDSDLFVNRLDLRLNKS